jgi:hypothetical protein
MPYRHLFGNSSEMLAIPTKIIPIAQPTMVEPTTNSMVVCATADTI